MISRKITKNDPSFEKLTEELHSEVVLQKMPGVFIEKLAECFSKQVFDGKEKFVNKNSTIDSYYLIYSGTVTISYTLDNNKEMVIDRLHSWNRIGGTVFFEMLTAEYDYSAESGTIIFSISKNAIEEVCGKYPGAAIKIREFGQIFPVYSFISALSLFKPLSSDILWNIACRLEEKTVSRDEVFIHQGEKGDCLYIIRKGQCRVFKDRDTVLATIPPGSIIGEMALLDTGRRTASVQAIDEITCYILKKEDFLEFLKQQDGLFNSIKEVAAGRVTANKQKDKKDKWGPFEKEFITSLGNLPAPEIEPAFLYRITGLYPYVRCRDKSESSTAILLFLHTYFGCRLKKNVFYNITGTLGTKDSFINLIKVCRKIGYKTAFQKGDLGILEEGALPAITYFEDNHWILVLELKNNKVKVFDPGKGIISYSAYDFLKEWSHYILFLSPTRQLRKEKKRHRPYRIFFRQISRFKKHMADIFLGSMALKILGIFLPLFNMFIIDKVLLDINKTLFIPAIIIVFIIILLQVCLIFVRQKSITFVNKKMAVKTVTSYFTHLISLPLRYFNKRLTGNILSQFSETEKVTYFLVKAGFQIFIDLITALLVSIILYIMNSTLAWIILVFISLDIIQLLAFSPALKKIYTDISNSSAAIEGHIIECFSGVASIRTQGIEKKMRWKFDNIYNQLLNKNLKGKILASYIKMINYFINTFSHVLLLSIGTYLVFGDKLSVGAFIAIISLVAFIREPIGSIAHAWDLFSDSVNAIKNVNEIYYHKPEESQDNEKHFNTIKGEIVLKNIYFKYKKNQYDPILDNITITIPPGEKVAVFGRSGCGKSTLLKLVLGLYQPVKGDIQIDNIKLESRHQRSYQTRVGAVLQESTLFKGSVKENILLGLPEASQNDIVKAAESAYAHQFISSLPGKYETEIKYAARNFSGGQRQRILIARTILKNPDLLIFDEAFSALDSEAESFILNNIMDIFKEKTILFATHRIHTLKKCDRILVMDRGTIVETGSHSQLMENKGLYYLLNSRIPTVN